MSTKYRDLFESLSARFNPRDLKTRAAGGGRNLTYITARMAMNRFDEVVGPENWRMRYRLECMAEGYSLVVCVIAIRLGDEWIEREDAGGFKEMTEKAWVNKQPVERLDKENTVKTGYSDAFKRAASAWGVGRYLYNDGDPIYQDELPPEEASQLPPPAAPVPETQPKQTIKGLYTAEHKVRTAKTREWIEKACKKVNDEWNEEWEAKAGRWMDDGLEVPAEMPKLINGFKACAHMLKWARENERIDASIIPEDLKPQQSEAVLALLFYDDAHKPAFKKEMGDYVEQCRVSAANAFYRKNGHLAPDGWAEEQAEAVASASPLEEALAN